MGTFTGSAGFNIEPMWFWTKKITEFEDGSKQIKTASLKSLKDIAKNYWLDGWIPMNEIDNNFLRQLENALRHNSGGYCNGIRIPDGSFLKLPEDIPEDYLMPEDDISDKKIKNVNEALLKDFRATKIENQKEQ